MVLLVVGPIMGGSHGNSDLYLIDTLRTRQNGCHFADNIFKCIFLNENVWIPIKISLRFVPKGPIDNIPALVQIMAWRRPGSKPLSEPMMVNVLMRICVTQPHWVNTWHYPCFWHVTYSIEIWVNVCKIYNATENIFSKMAHFLPKPQNLEQ